jgi:hypothetical protein
MRTEILLNNVDASTQQIGAYQIDCGQDMRWLLMIKSTGLDGIPQLFLEESSNNIDWIAIDNNDCSEGVINYFPLDDPLIHIRDSFFMGKSIRVRVEPNGNTTGTIYAELVVKTKSN